MRHENDSSSPNFEAPYRSLLLPLRWRSYLARSPPRAPPRRTLVGYCSGAARAGGRGESRTRLRVSLLRVVGTRGYISLTSPGAHEDAHAQEVNASTCSEKTNFEIITVFN